MLNKVKMETRFTEENINLIKTWKEYVDKGHYGNAKHIVDTYNIIFCNIKKPQQYTTCGSCLRRCVIEMYNALTKYEEEKLQALQALDELLTPSEEEIKEVVEQNPKKTKKK